MSECGSCVISGRVAVYRIKDGLLLRHVGRPGTGEGELAQPSAVAIDDEGQLWVAECGNGRVSIFR
jgi:hypothetical protein